MMMNMSTNIFKKNKKTKKAEITIEESIENLRMAERNIKNLINQHIGPEFSTLVHFEVQPIDGKTVIAVACRRSEQPVFLKAKSKETFYIRSGPSSVELSPSEVLNYLKQRD